MFKNKSYNLFSYLNILIAFLSAMISLVPMGLYINKFNEIANNNNQPEVFNQLLQPGFNQAGSLASSLTVAIVLSICVFLVMYFWLKDLQIKPRVVLDKRSFKFTRILAIISLIFIGLQLIAFFVCWLVPLVSNNYNVQEDAKRIAYLRIILYAAIGGTISIVNVLAVTCSTIYANFRISYYVMIKEEEINENKDK